MILPLAMGLDALLGEPKWLWSRVPHPVVLIGNAISWASERWNKGGSRKMKGAMLVLLLLLGSAAIGGIVSFLPWPIEVIAVAILLAQRSLADHVGAVAIELRKSLSDGKIEVAKIVGRDTSEMDESAVARAAIESAAENFSDGVVAPLFWYLILGVPGILGYKAINTADSMIGYRSEEFAEFGWASARLDDLLNWIPARISAVIFQIANLNVPALSRLRPDATRHRSPNAGWPEAAMAETLGIALSGPRSYEGIMREEAFVNEAGRKAILPEDIEASVRVIWTGWGVLLLIAAGLALVF